MPNLTELNEIKSCKPIAINAINPVDQGLHNLPFLPIAGAGLQFSNYRESKNEQDSIDSSDGNFYVFSLRGRHWPVWQSGFLGTLMVAKSAGQSVNEVSEKQANADVKNAAAIRKRAKAQTDALSKAEEKSFEEATSGQK